MRDDPSLPPNGEAYGLTRTNGSALPAFAAFRAGAKYLAGAKEAKWTRRGDLSAVVVQRNGEVTTALWNSGAKPITAQVPTTAFEGILIDKYGFGMTVKPVDGKYTFALRPAMAAAPGNDPQAYFLGGDPFLLIEPAAKQ